MPEINDKIVEYDKYCVNCKHILVKEEEEPCNECLTYPVNQGSIKPIHFEEAKN